MSTTNTSGLEAFETPHRLEYGAEWYQEKYVKNPANWGVDLAEHLRRHPDRLLSFAVNQAAQEALRVLHPELREEMDYKSYTRCYTLIGHMAISAQEASVGHATDTLPLENQLNAPTAELREVGRLAVQMYSVLSALQVTGEVRLP